MMVAVVARNNMVTIGFHAGIAAGDARGDAAVDAGGDAWAQVARLSPDRSADEYALLFQSIASRAPGCLPSSACVASVVPALTPRLVEALHLAFSLDAMVIGAGVKTGIKIRTDNPAELGADLVCAAVAARSRHRGACILVDFGAAISLTALNGQGELLGCAIAPGLETSARALKAATAQLPEVRLVAPRFAIGKNTAQSMQSGLVFGFSALVTGLIARIAAELGEETKVFATGDACGDAYAKELLPSLGHADFIPDLALEGVIHIMKANLA